MEDKQKAKLNMGMPNSENFRLNILKIRTEYLPELFHRILKLIIRKKYEKSSILNLPFQFYYMLFRLFGIQLIRRETIDLLAVGFQMNVLDAKWLTQQDIQNLGNLIDYLEDPETFQASILNLNTLWKISFVQLKEHHEFERDLKTLLQY